MLSSLHILEFLRRADALEGRNPLHTGLSAFTSVATIRETPSLFAVDQSRTCRGKLLHHCDRGPWLAVTLSVAKNCWSDFETCSTILA
jgi:hypothetical protein